METNLFGTLSMIRAFSPALARNGGGAIVNVLSAASWFTVPGHSSYAVTKAAAWSLTNGVRLELASQGTLVTGVHVGLVDTDLTANLDLPKMTPAEFARITLDGVEDGRVEIVADEISLRIKGALSGVPGEFAL
jgi:NAD(P)-dependent dehydrogenase (short-subunit alcohol dehydrogenase family)